MRTIIITTISLFIFLTGKSQTKAPQQYINLFGGSEWNTLSVAAGGEYEHVVSFNGKNMFSVKAFAMLPYEYSNFALLTSSGYDGRAYRYAVLANGNFYMGKNGEAKGFYFTLGAGPGISTVKQKIYNNTGYKINTTTLLKLAAETGAGVEFGIGGNTHMRLGVTTRWGVFVGGHTAIQMAIGL